MKGWIVISAFLFSPVCSASPRAALIAVGRCQDPDLVSNFGRFAAVLESRLGPEVLVQQQLVERLPGESKHTVEELEHLLENSKAEQQLEGALAEIERLPPGEPRRRLWVDTVLRRGQLLRGSNRKLEADETFRRVLRLEPNHVLNADYFSPLTQARFDRIRRDLAKAPKVSVKVISEPAGAAVYLDGLKVSDSTPFTVELVPGEYAIAVAKDGLVSFPHRLSFAQASSIHLDLKLEGAVRATPIPCIALDADHLSLGSAVKLAAWLDLDQVVLLRIDRNSPGPSWLAASLIEAANAQKLREGGLKLEDLSNAPGSLEQLGDFIVTGTPGSKVFAAVSDKFGPAPGFVGQGTGGSAAVGKYGDQVSRTEAPSQSWKRPLGFGLIGGAGVMLGLAVVLQVKSNQSWGEVSSYYATGKMPSQQELPAVQDARSRAEGQRTAATVFYLASGLAATGGAVLLLTDQGRSPIGSSAVSIRGMPGAVLVSGRWP
jgi:hypothetical protein